MCLPKCPETNKSAYRTRGEALEWARRQPAPRSRAFTPPHRAYVCPHCGHWHLTKQPRSVDPLSRARALYHRTHRHAWRRHE